MEHISFQAILQNLTFPPVLFFVLGFFATSVGSNLEIPSPIIKGLSAYLMVAIGFKGGWQLSQTAISFSVLVSLIGAVALGLILSLVAYFLLRKLLRIDVINSAAIAAHYGSVSAITFITAAAFLAGIGVPYEGHTVAMLALMESPAIVVGILLAKLFSEERSRSAGWKFFKEVAVEGSVILLLGGILIGMIVSEDGAKQIHPLFETYFVGILCFFLLNLGMAAATRFSDFMKLGLKLSSFGIYMPLLSSFIALALGKWMNLSVGGMTMFAVLAASASYIAAPAAVRVSLPKANPSLYMTLSLAVTFPFNITVGIPIYYTLSQIVYNW